MPCFHPPQEATRHPGWWQCTVVNALPYPAPLTSFHEVGLEFTSIESPSTRLWCRQELDRRNTRGFHLFSNPSSPSATTSPGLLSRTPRSHLPIWIVQPCESLLETGRCGTISDHNNLPGMTSGTSQETLATNMFFIVCLTLVLVNVASKNA